MTSTRRLPIRMSSWSHYHRHRTVELIVQSRSKTRRIRSRSTRDESIFLLITIPSMAILQFLPSNNPRAQSISNSFSTRLFAVSCDPLARQKTWSNLQPWRRTVWIDAVSSSANRQTFFRSGPSAPATRAKMREPRPAAAPNPGACTKRIARFALAPLHPLKSQGRRWMGFRKRFGPNPWAREKSRRRRGRLSTCPSHSLTFAL
jgi:hypothetical protein